MIFFFFKQKTAYELRISDWSSDVCSSDLQWLNYVRTGRARSEIRHYLRTVKYEESIAFGLRLLNQAFDPLHLTHPAEDDLDWEKLANSSGASSRDAILADIGLRSEESRVGKECVRPSGFQSLP